MEVISFPGGSEGKASACKVEDLGSIPGSGTSLGEGNGNPLQYSCLEKSHGQKSLVQATSPWGHKESDMTERLHFHFNLEVRFGVISIFFFMFFYVFQNVLKCIQFKIKFRFMCFFQSNDNDG